MMPTDRQIYIDSIVEEKRDLVLDSDVCTHESMHKSVRGLTERNLRPEGQDAVTLKVDVP